MEMRIFTQNLTQNFHYTSEYIITNSQIKRDQVKHIN
jgi:hypothetical protein